MLRWAQRAADAIGGTLFTAMFLVFLVQIAARFGFNRPLPWTDELAVVLYVWVILWAAAFMVPAREHVVFDLVWNAVGRRGRRVMAIAGQLLIGGLAAWALPASWDYVHFMRARRHAGARHPVHVGLSAVRAAAGGAGRCAPCWAFARPGAGEGLDGEVRG